MTFTTIEDAARALRDLRRLTQAECDDLLRWIADQIASERSPNAALLALELGRTAQREVARAAIDVQEEKRRLGLDEGSR